VQFPPDLLLPNAKMPQIYEILYFEKHKFYKTFTTVISGFTFIEVHQASEMSMLLTFRLYIGDDERLQRCNTRF